MGFLRRTSDDGSSIGDVLWGVARKPGYSDTDDPVPHVGATQHAFEMGHDTKAICGFQPPRRQSGTALVARPLLAVPGPTNPRCPRCEAIVARTVGSPRAAASGLRGQGPLTRVVDASDLSAGNLASEAMEIPWEGSQPDADAGESAQGAENVEPETYESEEDEPVAGESPARPLPLRRRSVRRGGVRTIKEGRRSITVFTRGVGPGGVVAELLDAPDDMRVSSVSVRADGSVRINLNQPASEPLNVAWYVVSKPD